MRLLTCRQRKKHLALDLEQQVASLQQQVAALQDMNGRRDILLQRNAALQVLG